MSSKWKLLPLNKVCEKVTVGHVGSTSQYYRDKGIVFLRTQNVGVNGLQLNDVKYVTPDFHESLKKSQVFSNDILLTRVVTDSIKCAIVPSDFGPANCANVILIRPKPELSSRFLYYLTSSPIAQTYLLDRRVGSAQLVVNTKVLKDWVVPIPPLPEQKRIVALLDEAFAGISQAIDNTEKNLANARELFESYLNDEFGREDEGWERCTLESLLEKGWIISHLDGNHGGDYPKKEEFLDCGVPYISANCIKEGKIDFNFAKYLSPKRAASLRKGIAINNDVIFAHNATVGPVALLHTKEEKVVLGTSLTYYRCNEEYIQPEYLVHYMQSPGFINQYSQVMRQSTRNQVPITMQRTFQHVVPPLQEQQRIATKLDKLSIEVGALKSIYQQKLTALAELKQSILQKAFTGELTQDLPL